MTIIEREAERSSHLVIPKLPHLPTYESPAPHLDELSEDVFSAEMHDFQTALLENITFFAEQQRNGEEIPSVIQAALQKLYREKVIEADYQELSKLCEALYCQLLLPQFKKTLAPIHERWTDLRNRPLNKEEREEKRRISPQREHWRYQISSCNQALQNMIEFTANRLIKPEELTKVIQGLWRSPNPKDAELYVRGIQAEIAAAHCIAQSGREVTYSSIEEDMCGKDIWVMGISGNKIGYDIKCTPLSSSYGIEKENAIFIDPSWLDNYQIRPEFVSMVLKQL